ncbi:hypothetical protein Fmac_025672 [Flemingia macrophylla]|uniref:Uncharacterized protein n=1 Tax=Flemingia macrophylla TaxID=520843 RepID=A0ABD1LSY5_9FABA
MNLLIYNLPFERILPPYLYLLFVPELLLVAFVSICSPDHGIRLVYGTLDKFKNASEKCKENSEIYQVGSASNQPTKNIKPWSACIAEKLEDGSEFGSEK